MEQLEFNKLIEELKNDVNSGDVVAMKWLGDVYYQGLSGQDSNCEAALPYWQMAADHGDNEIACKVGLCYLYGYGGKTDAREAVRYLVQSADAGVAQAQYQLGLCYLDGEGTTPDYYAGKRYLRMAALQNHPEAQLNLARELLKEDFSEAVHWVCCAHLNGVEDATEALKVLLESEENVPLVQDELECIKQYGVEPRQRYTNPSTSSDGGGCYIATAVYGSYDCPQVWTLRRYRDNVLSETWYGRSFIKIYYAVSPTLVKWFGQSVWFREFWMRKLDRMVKRLHNKGIENTPYNGDDVK